jgi:FHA domain-containing protein
MADPRLNSCHLTLSRRWLYRGVREQLLYARGPLTWTAEHAVGSRVQGTWPLPSRCNDPGANYVLVRSGDGRRYPLRTGLNTIGRSPVNNIVLDEIFISRRHCVVLVHATGGCEVYDTASRNGTRVNGNRLSRVWLVPGDVLKLCGLRFTLTCEANGEAHSFAHDKLQRDCRALKTWVFLVFSALLLALRSAMSDRLRSLATELFLIHVVSLAFRQAAILLRLVSNSLRRREALGCSNARKAEKNSAEV